ncbi:MAG: DNA polymerase III subunit delta' [Ruminococcaceae bacterium]|nr:DNA polymerase III subunit delta' [Oscillospiraceae bacterium]
MSHTPAKNSTFARRVRTMAMHGALPHALILSGTGDRAAAARFVAAAMQCSAKEDKPCLSCSQCRKVLEDIHPDLHFVEDGDHKELSVKAIREFRSDVYIRPNEGTRKVAVFPRAEQLNERDQNVLLKIVEEGPAYAAFIFCVENSSLLLPTVRSRCAELKLQEEDEMLAPDMALLRAFSTGKSAAVTEYLTQLEVRKLHREDLVKKLRISWRVCAEALLLQKGKQAAEPALQEGADLLQRSLTTKQLTALTQLLHHYALESNYNVGVGHVLGAIAAEWETKL